MIRIMKRMVLKKYGKFDRSQPCLGIWESLSEEVRITLRSEGGAEITWVNWRRRASRILR